MPEEAVTDARVVITTAKGEECQVDYGDGPMVRDPQTQKYRRTRLFVLTLGYSRKCVRLLAFRSSARVWAELHEKAFRRLGGVTRTLVSVASVPPSDTSTVEVAVTVLLVTTTVLVAAVKATVRRKLRRDPGA